jgi:hypothetical protein
VIEERVTTPQAARLPFAEEALKEVGAAISACTKAGLFAKPPVTELSVATKVKKEKEKDAVHAWTSTRVCSARSRRCPPWR